MGSDEKLVLEGGRLKLLCEKRQLDAKHEGGIIIDYHRFTIKRADIPFCNQVPGDSDDENLAKYFATMYAALLGFQVGVDRPGRDYYEFTTTIDNENGHEVASVSAGGATQRGTICFTLKGEGCTHARPGWEKRVHDYFAEMSPKTTRIDLAKDFFNGEVIIDELVHLYRHHEFSYRGRLPSHQTHGCWLEIEGLKGHSRTFQVGKRESGKLFRGYEKGHQFGLMESRWLRCEVELRSVNRVVPWDALISPAEYFAGAYEATRMLGNREVATRIQTRVKVAEASAQRCINWVKRVVAPTLVQISKIMPDDEWLSGLVVDQLHRKMPRSLRGLQAHTMQHGIKKALEPYVTTLTNLGVPATVAI